LQDAADTLKLDATEVGSAVDAFHFIQQLRLRSQLTDGGQERTQAKWFNPATFSVIDRRNPQGKPASGVAPARAPRARLFAKNRLSRLWDHRTALSAPQPTAAADLSGHARARNCGAAVCRTLGGGGYGIEWTRFVR
jgi:hypothetical protein